ncbi:tyrosine-type recombinase/integrase [Enterobacter cloacae complex sp. CARB60]|uniref:tyrosine-type recombinase/integrase n=1 Tax=Enterobacter cloacae complex sp. CARB60 TaxID=3119569 RepID=UPI002F408EEB
MKKLTTQDIDLFVAGMNAEILQYVEDIPGEARTERLNNEEPTPIEFREACSSFFQEHFQDALFSGDESGAENYFRRALSSECDIQGMEKEIASAAANYAVLLHQSQEAHSAFLRKDLTRYSQIVSNIKQNAPVPRSVQNAASESASQCTLTLAEAWKGFVKFKSDWTPKNRQESEKYYEVIEAVLGADTIVDSITRRDIKNLLEMAAGLPQQNKKPYNKMTTQECLDADDIPEENLVSSRTVNGYLKLCQGLFAYLVKEEDVLDSSPTNNVKFEAKSRSYGNYSLTEMRKLVAYFATLEDWKKWVFLLLAYTGARRSEIAALKVSDIRLDDDSQRHYVMIQDSKTDAGIRQIPLSLRLVEMNFLGYLKDKNPDARLFPQVTNKTQLTRIFHGIRETLGIHYLDDFKRRRIIHSLRHTFVTEAAKTNNLPLVQRTVGHELSRIGQTQVYIHEFNVSALLPVIDCIDWR